MPAKPQPVVDPYTTLGVEAGAPMAEVKRAYRRMAKAFHPDSAGEAAIPRFLAIQAAYEQIRTGRVVLGGTRAGRAGTAAAAQGTAGSGRSTGSAGPAAGEPWRADPARARAARERARTGTAGASSSGTGGAKAGAASGGRRATGTSGSAGGGASASGGTRKRATRKATMGSTSYDEARDRADATWSGASWYGPSTGEYWIVNPREYADPRKHGPDYQQRARRPLSGSGPEAVPEAERVTEPAPDETATSTSGPTTSFDRAAPAASAGAAGAGPTASAGAAGAGPTAAPRERRARSAPRWAANATESGWAAAGESTPSAAAIEERARASLHWLGEPADDPVRRFGLALVAWPPIGLVTAALIGDATGCATFGAQCDGAEPMLPWLAQAVILGLLLLLPPVTRVLAAGAIAVLVGLIPVTMLLLAVGAGGAPEAAPTMAALLAAAWLVGVTWATAMRMRRAGAVPQRGGGT